MERAHHGVQGRMEGGGQGGGRGGGGGGGGDGGGGGGREGWVSDQPVRVAILHLVDFRQSNISQEKRDGLYLIGIAIGFFFSLSFSRSGTVELSYNWTETERHDSTDLQVKEVLL